MAHGKFFGNCSMVISWSIPFPGANKLSQASIRRIHHFILELCLQSEPMKVSRLEDQWVTEVEFSNISIFKAVGFCKNHPRRCLVKAHFPSYSVLQSPDDEVFHSARIECPKKCPPNPCKMGFCVTPTGKTEREKWFRDSSQEYILQNIVTVRSKTYPK